MEKGKAVALFAISGLAVGLALALLPWGLAIPAGLGFAVAAFLLPKAFLWASVASTAFLKTVRLPVIGPRLTLSEVFMAGFLMEEFLTGRVFSWSWGKLRRHALGLAPLAVFAAFIAAQVPLYGPEAFASRLVETAIFVYGAFFMIVVYLNLSVEGALTLLRWISLFVPLAAIVGFLFPNEFLGTTRVIGTFRDPNQLASYLLLLIPFSVLTFSKGWTYVLAPLNLLALFLTGSRSGLVGFLAGTVAFLTFCISARGTARRIALVAGPALMLVGAAYLLNPERAEFYLERFSQTEEIVSQYAAAHSVQARKVLWRASLEAWRESPVFGIGYGSFVALAHRWTPFQESEVHNSYLRLLAETGVVGLVLVLGFYFYLLKLAWRRRRERLGAALFWAMASFMFFSMGVDALRMRNFWLMASMLLWMGDEGSSAGGN